MLYKKDRFHYSRNIKVGIGISLIFLIISFIFFPRISTEEKTLPIYFEPLINVVEIPVTVQSRPPALQKREINEPDIFANISPVEDSESLSDTKNPDDELNNSSNGSQQTANTNAATGVRELSSLPFIPRQLIEVVPENIDDDVKGRIKLSLVIGADGKVKQYNVLSNTTNSAGCLEKVIEAIHKSKWQPINIEGVGIEYRLEKIFHFN